ncbi:HAD family hydrolase [Patescibacteria group bacterium]|nr:HAD family hydrolase [Patescibacteria group bacterium]
MMEIKNIKAILFDFDGTLVDTMGCFGEIASELMNKYYGLPVGEAKEKYFLTSGDPFFQQLEVLFPGDPKNHKVAEEYEKRKIKGFSSTKFPKATLEALKKIKEHHANIKLVLSSNNFQNLVDDFITRHRIDIFDLILGYRNNFSKGKEHFEHIKNHFGLQNSELLFIGDSLSDAKRAIDNYIAFIAFMGTFSQEDWKNKYPDIVTISSIKEINDLFGE